MKESRVKFSNNGENSKTPSYVFVLKEGKAIEEDFLDYSLMLLQIGQIAVLPSPNSKIQTTILVSHDQRR